MCENTDMERVGARSTIATTAITEGQHQQPKGSSSSSEGGGFFSCCFGSKPSPKSGRDLGVWESSLEDRAGIWSLWTLSYLNPLLKLGSTKVLDADDIGVPSDQDRADRAYQVALDAWNKQSAKAARQNETLKAQHQAKLDKCTTEQQRAKVKPFQPKEPSIATALFCGYGPWTIVAGLLYNIVSSLLGFVPVLILNDLVQFFETGQSVADFDGAWYQHPWTQVAALGVCPILISILNTRHMTIMSHAAVFVRTAVSTMLYRKALRVSAAGRAKTSTGQVVNMMSNDTAQLQRFLQFGGLTLMAPIQIVLALYLIYQQVGNATWVGVGLMVFLAPINMVVFSIVSKQRRKVLKYSDLRVKMMNEILSGIRIIKFYAWERPFGKEVGVLRDKEMAALTKLAYTSAVGFSLILMSAPLIQPILVFMTYVAIQDEPLSASTAFTTVALFNMMRFPFAFLPMGLLQYIQSMISLRRLERYLDLPELSEYVVNEAPPDATESEATPGSVTIRSGSAFTWIDPDAKPVRPVQEEKKKKERRRSSKKQSKEDAAAEAESEAMRASIHSTASSAETDSTHTKGPLITLSDVACHIKAGSLVAVVGNVGSGKSSFLSTLLGELETLQGSKVYTPRPAGARDVGYVSYCAQTPWVVNDTLRGNILFGREFDQERYDEVVEACALLDDLAVLPAGDMTEIGERGINLSGGQKARVSLARALYSRDTGLVLLDDPLSAVDAHVGEHIFARAIQGHVSANATRVLVTHHVHLLARCDSVIVLERGRIKHQGAYADLVAQGVDFAGAVDVSKIAQSSQETTTGEDAKDKKKGEENASEEKKETPEISDEKKEQLKKSGKKLVSDEEREEGNVAGSAYTRYAKAGGLFPAIMIVVVQGLGRASEVVALFWLSYWAEEAINASKSGNPHSDSDTTGYVAIYAAFGLFGVLGLTLRGIIVAVHRLRASVRLHDGLTNSVLRAPVSFHDVTPVGRILNRFAADMDKVDLEITQSLSQGVSTLFNVLGAVGAICVATNGTFLGPLVPMGYVYYVIQKWFRKTSTELQRVNSVANSPIFSDFSQTLTGTSTIRAYGEEARFFNQCKSSFDTMNGSYVLVQLAGSWLALRLDALGGCMGAFIGGIAVATSSSGFISAGWLGLALSYSIEVTNFLKHGVRMIATIEAQMNSVERILYFTDNITPEAPEFIPDKDPDSAKWPSSGEIELRNASMRYRDGPLVLKDVSLKIKGAEKIGICGRTGSGKSSLMIALFRISEIENDGGGIYIDGVNSAEIGTSALRLGLSIIPQDPIVFSNTVRYNLDPFGKSHDAELWEVLKKVQMAEVIAELPGGLNEQVAEGGENFSQGQRQLLCIARALLRKPRILVLDEATASIDNATDASIQEMIRENFRDATVLTIAHRLNTILDSDRVLVLDDGRIAEFDSPQRLLEKDDGHFKAMIEKSKAAHSEVIDED